MAIVLASQSPRRQELLARIGVEDFKTLSLDIDESYPEGLSPCLLYTSDAADE